MTRPAIHPGEILADELAEIDRYAVEGGVNLWEKPATDQDI